MTERMIEMKEKKEAYQPLELEIIIFDTEDVITTSGGGVDDQGGSN